MMLLTVAQKLEGALVLEVDLLKRRFTLDALLF